MKKNLYSHISFIQGLAVVCMALAVLFFVIPAEGKGVKTSYKRYSIFKYKNQEVLCEPYTVNKDDWLYKIFRKKGEISEKDFPHFLLIFKELNPQISNIDAIEPGIPILIPLKKVKKKDYDLSTPDNVDVPFIEFSTLSEDKVLEPFLQKHTIKKGENISSLVDKQFLEKGGRLSEEGLKAFQLANPNIKNINIVYEGEDIFLPDPSISAQPWFQSFFSKKAEKAADIEDNNLKQPYGPSLQPEYSKIDELKLLQLKKYTSLIGGTLLSQGKMYFPSATGENQVIDLSTAPVIETEDGTKILVFSGSNQNDMLLKQVQAYWKDLRIQAMSETLKELKNKALIQSSTPPEVPVNPTIIYKNRVQEILAQTGHEYIPDTKIPFTMNNIQLEASFGRIIREEQTDLLINFGNVYGKALEVLGKKEFEIISITPKLSTLEVSLTLFSSLGYATWDSPSFFTGKKAEKIPGVYAVKQKDKLFVPDHPLSRTATTYLQKEQVKIISLSSDSALTQ